MKYLIIPDIHTHYKRVEKIYQLEAGNYEKVIHLGDYFDDFGDSVEQNEDMAHWLQNGLKDKNKIFLIGNHDISYINPQFACSGYTNGKWRAISSILEESDWGKMLFYYSEVGYFFSHAGRHYCYKDYELLPNEELISMALNGKSNWVYSACGRCRGGMDAFGGLLWCDFNKEFSPIPGVNQIFGHTPQTNYSLSGRTILRRNSKNYCLDSLAKVSCYGLLNEDELTVKFYDHIEEQSLPVKD